MLEEIVEIEGLEECVAFLRTAPRAAAGSALIRGLRAGGEVIEQAIEVRTPVREGEMKADLDIAITIDADVRGGIAQVGFGEQGYKANFVEYGHRMIGHKPEKKDLGAVEPHPFLRPAAAACQEAAVDAFVEGFLGEMAAAGVVDEAA